MLLFLAVVGTISGWWLSRQRLTAKPWLEEGTLGEFPGTGAVSLAPAKIGLGVFLTVAGCLFALLISAYIIRTDIPALNLAGRAGLPAPRLLWLNTFLLVLSSAALQWACAETRHGNLNATRQDLLAAAVATLAFVAGQLLVWRQLVQAGYYLASDPAYSFFYLLTGAHGLHVLGGLAALARTIAKTWRGIAGPKLRQSVQLCAIYWHFLLLVWLVVFSLIMGWAGDLVDICRAFIT
jgi:cytochrome c oxidase subunit III